MARSARGTTQPGTGGAGSIIARMLLYGITIQTLSPNQPIAQSLPEIFPGTTPTATLPTFRFNWVALDGVQVITSSGVTIVDELDEFEIRSAASITLALGQRDTSFPEPIVVEPEVPIEV